MAGYLFFSTKQIKDLTRYACTYKRTIEGLSPKNCCREKVWSTTYSECVSVALVTQHAKSMCRIYYTRSHQWPVQLYRILPQYPINGTIFGEKMLLKNKRFFRFSLKLLFETILILRKTQERYVINLHAKYPLLLTDCIGTFVFFYLFGATAPSGPGPPHSRGF